MNHVKGQKGWLTCSKCALHKTRDKVVLGYGNLNAKIMFVGEGPGYQENLKGLPFVGPSGELLNKFLTAFDIDRNDVFFDNAVACWPHFIDEMSSKRQSRKPSSDEIMECKSRLELSIYTVDPTIIVALGGAALQALTGETGGITSCVGNVYETEVQGWYGKVKYPVYAMFHPAYLLRQTPPNPNEKKPDEQHPYRKTYKHFEDLLDTVSILNEAYYGVDYQLND